MSQTPVLPKLGIIAGGGDLPKKLAEHACKSGREVFVLGARGFVDDGWPSSHDHVLLSIGETGAQIKALNSAGVVDLCFAGIIKRPDFSTLKLDAKGLRVLPRVLAAASKGDDSLMRAMLSVFEEAGFNIVGADDIVETLVVAEESIGTLTPSDADRIDIRKAADVAGVIGRMDIGQGAVVCRGLVLAVEAQEGTDAMLTRCASLPEELRGTSSSKSGVLVKRAKPQQERRIDLPTIGIDTVRNAHTAGLTGIAIEAGGALVIDRQAVSEEADRLGLWIVGMPFQDSPE